MEFFGQLACLWVSPISFRVRGDFCMYNTSLGPLAHMCWTRTVPKVGGGSVTVTAEARRSPVNAGFVLSRHPRSVTYSHAGLPAQQWAMRVSLLWTPNPLRRYHGLRQRLSSRNHLEGDDLTVTRREGQGCFPPAWTLPSEPARSTCLLLSAFTWCQSSAGGALDAAPTFNKQPSRDSSPPYPFCMLSLDPSF